MSKPEKRWPVVDRLSTRPRAFLILVLLAACPTLADACSSAPAKPGTATARTALGPSLTIMTYASTTTWTTTCTMPTIPSSTPKTPITACPAITLPTVNVNRPNPYDPGYHTVGQLVHDSGFIFVGSLLGAPSCPSGAAANCYQSLSVQEDLGGTDPRTNIAVPVADVTAAKLNATATYVFFWGAEAYPLKGGACIIGGIRGVMAYDGATNAVTRLDNSTNSQIPRSQTLDQLRSEIEQVEAATARAPEELPPAPVCSSSATGVPNS